MECTQRNFTGSGEPVGKSDSFRRILSPHRQQIICEDPAPEIFSPHIESLLDGLLEIVCLMRPDGEIVATNLSWKNYLKRMGEQLDVGDNWFQFVRGLAVEGDEAAVGLLRRMVELCAGKRNRFSHLVSDTPSNAKYKIVVSAFDSDEERLILITSHDVTELVDLKRQRRQFGSRLLRAQEQERRRMARDLHDSTSQLLVGLQLSLMRLKGISQSPGMKDVIAECEDTIGRIQREIRALSFLSHAPPIDAEGLAVAVDRMISGFGKRTGITMETHLDDIEGASHSTEAAIYRLVQEALSNIYRHARASTVRVWLIGTRKYIHVTIKDDGIGFEMDRQDLSRPSPLGVGVMGMKERVSDLGGRLMIHKLDKGTALTASLPYRKPV